MKLRLMKLRLYNWNAASMIFWDHPSKFDVWKESDESLLILSREGEPLATIAPYKKFMSNRIVERTFLNKLKEYGRPWIPTGRACEHGVAVWHDASDAEMIGKYKIKPMPFEDTLYDATEAPSQDLSALSKKRDRKENPESLLAQRQRRKPLRINYKEILAQISRLKGGLRLQFLPNDYPSGKTLTTYNCITQPGLTDAVAVEQLENWFREVVDATLDLGLNPMSHKDIKRVAKMLKRSLEGRRDLGL